MVNVNTSSISLRAYEPAVYADTISGIPSQPIPLLASEIHVYDYSPLVEAPLYYDIQVGIEEWGINMWFSNTPQGKPLGREIRVTHRADFNFRVEDGNVVMYKNNDFVEILFEIIFGLSYYINVSNRQGNLKSYYLMYKDLLPATDLMC